MDILTDIITVGRYEFCFCENISKEHFVKIKVLTLNSLVTSLRAYLL